ncbi:hypothetical protein [Streptomyces sp. NPDC029003]|uniref:hypothetical protein n=1 Tax=Streptomyces sp. NPDC029003 TaxID=3155125 RepID=UPI0033ECC84F
MSPALLPPVAPEVLAEAVEGLTARLRKRLDAAIAECAAVGEAGLDGGVTLRFGEDALVTLRPDPSGTITDPAQATCTCLLSPRCLHRTAALGAAPLAEPGAGAWPEADRGSRAAPHTGTAPDPGPAAVAGNTDRASAPGGGAPAPGPGTGGDGAFGPATAAGPGPGPGSCLTGGSAPAGGPTGRGVAAAPSTGTAGPSGGERTAGPGLRPGAGGATDGSGRGPGVAAGGGDAAAALTGAQVAAGAGLWAAAAEALAAGVTAAGAVTQAELLRAAHTARLAGLPQAEAAALRVVRGLRGSREREATQRLGDLTTAFRELLHTAALLASGTAGPGPSGGRRPYVAGGSLRVYGLCREPVLTATGYGGVVTHLLGADGRAYSLSDVRPGGLARARGAGAASVALGGGALDHAGLARAGLRVVGATVSADGRLGAGRGVRATPAPGASWAEEPLAALFARPVAEAVAGLWDEPGLLGCDVEVVGAAGDDLLVREPRADAPLLRLRPAHPHPELGHGANLRRLAGYPGLAVRVLGRPDPDRAATLSPLAVGPVPGAAYTLRLPEEWGGRADLGYDRLQGAHFPAAAPAAAPLSAAPPAAPGADPLADAPLWRVGRLLETGVAGGRRAVAETARGPEPLTAYGPLRRAGFTTAAELAAALVGAAGRRPRDVFGRLGDASADAYARAWLAASVHLTAARRALVTASWT